VPERYPSERAPHSWRGNGDNMHRNTDSGWGARPGIVDLKTIIALVFALGGLSWAVVAMLGTRGAGAETGPKVIASSLDEEGNAVEADYTSTNGKRRIGEAREEIAGIINAEASEVLASISVLAGTPEGVSEAVVSSFMPMVSGDYDAFRAAIEAMGGQIGGELDEEHPIFTHLEKVFLGAKIDLERITVQKYEGEERPMMGMGTRRQPRQLTDEEREQVTGSYQTQTQRTEIRSVTLFPDAPEKSDPSAIEVKIPVLPKGEDLESVFSLILTWNADARKWQPATFGIIKNRLVEGEG
jgi:hypothetical protein